MATQTPENSAPQRGAGAAWTLWLIGTAILFAWNLAVWIHPERRSCRTAKHSA